MSDPIDLDAVQVLYDGDLDVDDYVPALIAELREARAALARVQVIADEWNAHAPRYSIHTGLCGEAVGVRHQGCRVTPRNCGVIPDAERARILAAMSAAKDADTELRGAVVAGLLAGGSVREVAGVTGMSTNTIQRWGHEGGWPSTE